jgi:NAD(P)-dependent dehydrogenase (short-subunit alcohol dehydrogenase family)
MSDRSVAVVVGAGPGLGASLARRFARADMAVAIASRNAERLKGLSASIGQHVLPVACDATREGDVEQLFSLTASELGPPQVVVYNASGFGRASIVDTKTEDFERAWRAACLGGFLVGRAAARDACRRAGRNDSLHRRNGKPARQRVVS